MEVGEILLGSLLGLVTGLLVAWFTARSTYRRKLDEVRFQAAHDARRTAYEATVQWVGAAALASRLQAEQARLGGAHEILYEGWPQPPAELWALYVSDRVKTLHAVFSEAAGRVHSLAGRLRAQRELLEAVTHEGHGDAPETAVIADEKKALEAALTSDLETMEQAQSSLLVEMRSDLIGTT